MTRMMTMAQVVGSNVARLRAERDWSYSEMSTLIEALGSRWIVAQLIQLEKGRRKAVNIDELVILSVCFSVPLKELLRTEDAAAIAGGQIPAPVLASAFSSHPVIELRGDNPAYHVVHQGDPWAVIASQRLNLEIKAVIYAAACLYGTSVTAVRAERIREAGAHGNHYAVRNISRELREEIACEASP